MTVPQQPQNLPPSAWIDLTIQGNVMTSNMITPDVWVNGYRIPTVYGYQQIPMSPGPVHIEAHAQWVRRYGQARLDFPLRPGERVPVFYLRRGTSSRPVRWGTRSSRATVWVSCSR